MSTPIVQANALSKRYGARQLHGALEGAPLPAAQSFLLIWPQLTGLLAGLIVLFIGYVLFQRQENRA